MNNVLIETVNSNVMRLAAALKQAGAFSATLSYSGSGDSGDVTEQSAQWPDDHTPLVTDDDAALGDVSYLSVSRTFNGNGFEVTTRDINSRFMDALGTVAMQAVDASGNAGWENNEGGSGEFVVYASGYAVLEHSNNEMDSETEETVFDENHGQWDNIQRIAEALTVADAMSVTVTYYGSGDSGEINDISIEWAGSTNDSGLPVVKRMAKQVTYQGNKRVESVEEMKADFKTAVSDIVWDMIDEAGNRGFENGDGGEGSATIQANGTAHLYHTNFSEEEGEAEVVFFGENIPEDLDRED